MWLRVTSRTLLLPCTDDLPWWLTCSHATIGSLLDLLHSPVLDCDLVWLKPKRLSFNSHRKLRTWVLVDRHEWLVVVVDCD